MKRLLTALAAVAALCAAASAAPDDKVDRARLRNAAQLPSVGPRGWYYSTSIDGRTWATGEEPNRCDVATLRARTGDDESDPRRWLDLAAALRREKDADGAKDALERARTLVARAASDRPDDGQPLGELALILAATGDDAGADKCVTDAARKTHGAWAGAAARADLVVIRALAKAAGCRFGTLDDACRWLNEDDERAAGVDRKSLDAAGAAYDEAVSLAEREGVKGQAGSSVYIRRGSFVGLLDACAPEDAPREEHALREVRAAADQRRALELLAPDPFALTLMALDDAMTEPADEQGNRHVQTFSKLPQAARDKFGADVARLQSIADSGDAATSARALQGIACLQWFVLDDNATTETTLRQSIAKDKSLNGSWNALVFVLACTRRWDEIAKVCAAWIEAEDGAGQRMMLGKALWATGDAEGAEKHWRAALALEPSSSAANVGVAVLVLRRAKTDADVAEARRLLRVASAALPPPENGEYLFIAPAFGLADAVALGLSGDLDACEKAARRLLEDYGEFPQARDVLAAIGR